MAPVQTDISNQDNVVLLGVEDVPNAVVFPGILKTPERNPIVITGTEAEGYKVPGTEAF